jgi:hypothetical protein
MLQLLTNCGILIYIQKRQHSMLYTTATTNRYLLSRRLEDGRLQKLISGVYTDDLQTPMRTQAMDPCNLPLIVSAVVGADTGVRVAYATGLDWPNLPADTTDIYLLSPTVQRTVELKNIGIRVVIRRSRKLLEKSHILIKGNPGTLLKPLIEQAILENFSVRKADHSRTDQARAQALLWELAERRQAAHGDAASYLPEHFLWIGAQLDLHSEAKAVAGIISQWNAASKLSGVPRHDWELIKSLRGAANLLNAKFPDEKRGTQSAFAGPKTPRGHINLHLMESYFSNYIEGTRLEISKALDVMKRQPGMYIPAHKDEHDVLSNFLLIEKDSNSPAEICGDAEQYLSTIKDWHKSLFSHRLVEINAGNFKQRANRVGSAQFTAPELVEETLRIAHTVVATVRNPFARSVLEKISFISIHPFEDGNGRVSRLLLNNIREGAGMPRLVFPNVLRDDYMCTLPAWSTHRTIEPFLKFVARLEEVNAEVPWDEPLEKVVEFLKKKAAFDESDESRWGTKGSGGSGGLVDTLLNVANSKRRNPGP